MITSMRTALAVLAHGDYWKGACTLFYTLRKYGNLPKNVTPLAVGMEHCNFAEAVPIANDYSWIDVDQINFPLVANKFFSLSLGFDRVILMDADMLCVGDCSLLWSEHLDTLPFYAVRDVATIFYYQQILEEIGLDHNLLFNAGTMVFNREFIFDDFLTELRSSVLTSFDGGDQGYLNHYLQRNKRRFGFLPLEYNFCLDEHFPRMKEDVARIVHFTGSNANPWNTKISFTDWRWKWIELWKREWGFAQKM